MAVIDQPVTTYSDTTPQVRVIGDAIYIIDPKDTPFIAAIGGFDSARSKFKLNQNGTKIEILEDEYSPLASTCNHTTTIATNVTTWTVTDGSIFQDGQQIKIDDELMVVKAADATNNTITVYARDYGGTNATHATNAAIEIVGMARLEGDDADFGPVTDITAPYNYTSIFQKAFKVTGTQEVISKYGYTSEYERQASKTLPDLYRILEKACFHSVRAAGTATTPRSMGGLGTFITDNTVNAAGAITKTDVDDLSEAIYGDGGNPDLFVCNHAVVRDLKDIIDTSSFVNLTYGNEQLGMQPLKRLVTQYHSLAIVPSRFCPVGTAFMLDSRKVGLYPLRPFGWHELAIQGDSRRGEVVGEFSLMIANDKTHGKIYGITS